MENLNEDNIKKTTLSFLKGYYKFRPRKGETEAKTDLRGQGGIIADGFLAFTDEEDNRFISTFEATSNDTKNEVNYKIEYGKLAWDSFAFTSVLAAGWFLWQYRYNFFFLERLGLGYVFTVIVGVVLAMLLVLMLIFRNFYRYRYIYAVEQFKHYFANEQWISIGENVFESPEDKAFKELKDQCIRNGFGLIKVDGELKPQLIVTPARKDTFNQKRKAVQLVNLNEFGSRIKKLNYQKWLSFLRLGGNNKPPVFENIFRFTNKNYVQKGIAFFCWLAIILVYGYEYTKSEFEYVNEDKYPQEILDSLYNKDAETFYSEILDTLFVLPFDTAAIPYLDVENLARNAQNIKAVRRRGYDILIATRSDNEFIIYNCARFYNIDTTKYIIEDGVYTNLDEAVERMEMLKNAGIRTTALWLGCFANEPLGYTVFYDVIQNTKEEASLLYFEYVNQLKEMGPLERNIRIRTLVPDNRFNLKKSIE